MTTLIAAADGSALGNPGPAGWAWYIDEDRWAAGGWVHGTNNQGELMAVIDLFESTAQADAELTVLCDSQYVINAVTKWMPGWKRRGWRKADGSPVLNRRLLERLDAALAGRRYRFSWVKGHAGHPLNEAADERARAVATAYQNGATPAAGPGFGDDRLGDDRFGNAGLGDDRFGNAGLGDDRSAEGGAKGPGRVAANQLTFPMESDTDTVLELQRRLNDERVRRSPAALAALLHPDFERIDAAGRHTRDEAIAAMTAPAAASPRLAGTQEGLDTGLHTTLLTPDVALVRSPTTAARDTERSWLWLRVEGTWLLRLDQATPRV